MTKEQALELCVNDYQRKVVEATATATGRTKQKPFYENISVTDTSFAETLEKRSKKYEAKAQDAGIIEAYHTALKQGFTYAECVAALQNLYKEKRIAELEEELAKLRG